MANRKYRDKAEQLVMNLVRELYQTETSAVRHCRREADRLGEVTPAQALRAISEHAAYAVQELPEICAREQLPVSGLGALTGAVFSELRDKLGDVLIQSERSYRATLLGTRHGLDLVKLVGHAADAAGKLDLESFCQSWLTTRSVLVLRAEEALVWFSQHPEEAVRQARPLFTRLRTRTPAHA
jgi:hypothetical protein